MDSLRFIDLKNNHLSRNGGLSKFRGNTKFLYITQRPPKSTSEHIFEHWGVFRNWFLDQSFTSGLSTTVRRRFLNLSFFCHFLPLLEQNAVNLGKYFMNWIIERIPLHSKTDLRQIRMLRCWGYRCSFHTTE